MKINWPDNKPFAFSVFDDTDNARLEDVKAVYDLLSDLNIHTTKSVWIMDPDSKPRIGGLTCSNKEYLGYMKELKSRGFEIGLHNVSSGSSKREGIIEGLEIFKKEFGQYPESYANHADNLENIYWGSKRLSGLRKMIYRFLSSDRQFYGEEPNSEYYWTDLIKERIKYVRNFVFNEINIAKADPNTPYHDPDKPEVNQWFSSYNAENIEVFRQRFDKASVDKLVNEGGYTILYTHFCTFAKNGKVDPYFKEMMEYLASKKGWFVPVTPLLNHIQSQKGKNNINTFSKAKLEWKWLFNQIQHKLKRK